MSIYVGNLSYQVTQEDITTVFAEYGTVKRVHLPTDRETSRPRGFGFVEMSTDAEEDAAISALDGAEWMGRDLSPPSSPNTEPLSEYIYLPTEKPVAPAASVL